MSVRRLEPGDEGLLYGFLEQRLDTSVFLLSNAERSGLVYRPEPFCGQYYGSFDADRLTAVAALYWNGILMVQGERGLDEATRCAARHPQRDITGVIGPLALVERTLDALRLRGRPALANRPETLYALSLERLVVPPSLQTGEVQVRKATFDERRSVLVNWRVDYMVESLGTRSGAGARRQARDWLLRPDAAPIWVAVHEGRLVSMTGFNARARGIVQVGGVWTPPDVRGKGYARCALGGSLLETRAEGSTRSVLFTPVTNLAAQRCYESLGYETVGDYGLVLFRT